MSSQLSEPDRPPRAGGWLFRIGSVLGVPIFLTPSWLLVAGFITISYAGFLREQIPGASHAASYALGLVFATALAASVLLHEVGHTVVSKVVGLPVRRIVVFLLGGVSEIEGEASRPRDEFAIAAAGPLVSLGLAGGCWAMSLLPAAESAVGVLLLLLAWSNLVIAVFNVLPGLPLDGGRLVQALLWMMGSSRLNAIRIAAWGGRGVAALLGLAIVFSNAVLGGNSPADLASVGSTVMGFAVVAFLWIGAGQALQLAELNARAATLRLAELLRPSLYLPAHTPVSEAVRQTAESGASGIVVIDGQGRSRAIVDEEQVAQVTADRRPWTSLSQVARELEPGLILADDLAGERLIDTLRAHPASEYLVVGRDGVARGVVAAVDLARALGLPRPRQHRSRRPLN
ncbi:site-2 protease family protein [Jatrophihabitans sp.]|jgi:Zn-dependent protease/CBS domain-containing protein|uniref:site-2 protease family protein n=1 Tax=Jatrophihabitans sp. TaxID=1932789 RepID=UPI002EE841C4